jgi:restriction endonuclease Mrr
MKILSQRLSCKMNGANHREMKRKNKAMIAHITWSQKRWGFCRISWCVTREKWYRKNIAINRCVRSISSRFDRTMIYNHITNQLKHDLLNKLKTIDSYYFEQIVLKLLHRMWYGDMIETKKSKDGWIDWIINEDALGLEKIYIQTKRYTDTTVREPDIRQFIWAMAWRTQKGIFVTTSSFESKVYERVKELWFAVILIDWFRLVDLMVQYGVGVQVRQTYEIKSIDEDFFLG